MPLDERQTDRERDRALKALEETTLEHDLEILVREGEGMLADMKCVVEYRVGL